MALAADEEHLHTGVFYRKIRPTLLDAVQARRDEASRKIPPDIAALIQQYA